MENTSEDELPLEIKKRDPKGLYKRYAAGKIHNVAGLDLEVDFPKNSHVYLKWSNKKTIDSMFLELLDSLNQSVNQND